MKKDQQARVADCHGAIESGTNARIADILAYSMERFPAHHKINRKAPGNAARPVFEFSDVARLCHSREVLSDLEARAHACKTNHRIYRQNGPKISVIYRGVTLAAEERHARWRLIAVK
jgi:hypothetical protein